VRRPMGAAAAMIHFGAWCHATVSFEAHNIVPLGLTSHHVLLGGKVVFTMRSLTAPSVLCVLPMLY
jgi:hypothetical protein